MGTIRTHTYPNGLILAVETMSGVQSVGMSLLLPAGAACEPAGRGGVAAVLAEMILRGAGGLEAKAHSDALDQLGVHRTTEVQSEHLRLGAVMVGERMGKALPLLLDTIRRPHLADETFGPSRQLAMQAIESLDDEPHEKVMIDLKKRHMPGPFNRSVMGELEDLSTLTAEQVRGYFGERFVPAGSIMGVAGCVEFEAARDLVDELLGDWQGRAAIPSVQEKPMRGYGHESAPTSQQHIGVAYDAVSEVDEERMTQRLAVAVLSGGMSGRLFTEVREKRGLCYAVYAMYAGYRDRGAIYAYAGTAPERAAETLAVMTGELNRLSDGVEPDEFDRAVVGLKARLVMQGESTSARGQALARDVHLFGRPRSLEDTAAEIDAVTLDRLNAFVASRRPQAFTTLTIGPEPLAVS